MKNQFGVHQHLTVVTVVQDRAAVRVELSGVRGDRQWIDFRFPDAAAAADHARTIAAWRDRRRSLTYVRGGGHGVLVDDEELFNRSFGDEDAPHP